MDFLSNIDFAAIVKIVGLDIMLGGDNAIVIAMACMALHPDVRNKAIMYGTMGAVGARMLFLALASMLFTIPYLKIIAGAYLFFIAWMLLVKDGEEEAHVAQHATIWGAVFTIIMADIGMSLDNVLAVTAASQSAGEHALTYTIAGILLSIPIIVYGSKLIIELMEKFPVIIWLGGGLLGLVATEMILSDDLIKNNLTWIQNYNTIIEVTGFISVILLAKLTLKYEGIKQ